MGVLDGRAAFITGGSSGIGKGMAIRFAQEGARLAIADLRQDEAMGAMEEIRRVGGDACFLEADVSDPDQMQRAVDSAAARFGRLDIVCANAGINGVWAPIQELQPDEWDKTLNINLRGTYLTVHFAIPHLRAAGGGSIIITSSVNGTRTFSNPGASAYSTSKAGQIAFMKSAALELAQYKIRVNAICPGAIKTNIGASTTMRHTEEIAVKVELPEGRPGIDGGVGDIFEVADTCLFLASDLSRHISGVEIFVDGGASLLR